MRIISGTQFPADMGGSSHSTMAIRGFFLCSISMFCVSVVTLAIRPLSVATTSAASACLPIFSPTREISSMSSWSDCGARASTSGWPPCGSESDAAILVTAPTSMAQMLHADWVRIRSGESSRSSDSLSEKSASESLFLIAWSISRLEFVGSIFGAVRTGR